MCSTCSLQVGPTAPGSRRFLCSTCSFRYARWEFRGSALELLLYRTQPIRVRLVGNTLSMAGGATLPTNGDGPTSIFVGAVGRNDDGVSIILSTEFAGNH